MNIQRNITEHFFFQKYKPLKFYFILGLISITPIIITIIITLLLLPDSGLKGIALFVLAYLVIKFSIIISIIINSILISQYEKIEENKSIIKKIYIMIMLSPIAFVLLYVIITTVLGFYNIYS